MLIYSTDSATVVLVRSLAKELQGQSLNQWLLKHDL